MTMSLIDPAVTLSKRSSEDGAPGTTRRRAFKFAATLATLIGGLGAWKIWSGRSVHTGRTLVIAAAVLILYSLIHPAGTLALRKGWLRVGGLLGRVNSALILTVLYVSVITPLGLLLRLFGRRSVTKTPGGSYFEPRSAERGSKHFEHPY
jgi:hypothetical protein